MSSYVAAHYQQVDADHLRSPAGNLIRIAISGKGRYIMATDPYTGRRQRVYLEGLQLVPAMHYDAVQKYRQHYRSHEITAWYSTVGHFVLLNALVLSGLLISLYFSSIRYWPLLVLILLICNMGEWYHHRYDMHAPGIYSHHANQHHRFFTERMMVYDAFQPDGRAVFFALGATLKSLGCVALLALFCRYFWNQEAAATTSVGLLGYYWVYEWLHLAYHTPGLERIPLLGALRRHHQRHHRQSLMGTHNFNVTIPLADWLFGTYC